MIKIFGGVAKGFTLKAPSNQNTRPTSILLRRKFFDSVQDLTGYTFIDLCSGTGSVGLEALSRGAEKVHFVENSKQAYKVLKQNVDDMGKKFSKSEISHVVMMDFSKWLFLKFTEINSEKTFLFFDPPYDKIELYEALFSFLEHNQFLGRVIIEACQQKTLKIDEFEKKFGPSIKQYKKGTSYFLIYEF